ncbi:MAG: YCF48-related protein, partial [Thermoanaerobaculia bacterium]|nr:YCF48-related protein [Thermoanaerobaculia bacterium]
AVKAPLASRSLLLGADAANGRLVVAGERGHILISDDRGATWTQSDVPTRATLTAVFFHDDELGWAVGHDAVILRTTDGGSSWERVHWAPEDEAPLLDVWFADATTGYAIGSYGSFYVTRDGGRSWSFEPISEDDFHLNAIASAGDGLLFIAAESGLAYRSEDDGESWTELAPDYVGSFFGVLPLGGDRMLLFGLRGHLYRSEDAGETWTPVETGTIAMLNSGVRLEDGTVVIVGLGGVVLISKDEGTSFELHQQKDRSGIQKIVDAGDGSLLLVGESGVRMSSLGELGDGKGE